MKYEEWWTRGILFVLASGQYQIRQLRAIARLRPGADLNAYGTAGGLGEIPGAPVIIHIPLLHAPDHFLFVIYGVRRTKSGTSPAGCAEVVDTDILSLIHISEPTRPY